MKHNQAKSSKIKQNQAKSSKIKQNITNEFTFITETFTRFDK
jgi:hypothetical protein